MQRFNLLVFDWDGTLMDSEARIVACLRAAIEDLALEPRDDASLKNIIGLGLTEAINTLYPGSGGSLHKAMTDRYRYHFLTANPTASELFAGAAETVSALAETGYLLAVATGKGRAGLDKVLEETGLGGYFHATRCSDETFSKPHPLMLEQLMDELGTEPGETLMIGDTEYDMQMAGNARTAALAVSYGVHEKERLLHHNPLHCIDAIDELVQWLEQVNARPAAAG
ncbi:MAG: HAD-IA family hydrolase [Gammaproteobacteria bacterium]|nr:HAD-IA family hydrolase [Gammaproteobacteria bacterium]MCW8992486.1 HAD-IA family hydrolase [Gammaproteobacteria bacterium]